MVRPKAGEVVILPFPFSDLTQSKVRPALCLAAAGNGDWIFCQITSRPYSDPNSILLDSAHFASGQLHRVSYIRVAKLFTAHQSLLNGSVGQLQPAVTAAVLAQVAAIFRP